MKVYDNVFVFAGGGTGGHIYPGVAVARALKARLADRVIKIYWVGNGSKKAMDRSLLEKERDVIDGFFGIPAGKLRRYFSIQNFFDLFKIAGGVVKSLFILMKVRPAFVFSKGGYCSVPPAVAAKILGIKVFTHECDWTPGLATRINSRFAEKVFLSYEDTKRFFPTGAQKRLVVTGNPIREAFYNAKIERGLEFLGLKKTKPVLIVLGGSLGAKEINDLVEEILPWLLEHFIVIHQTGATINPDKKLDYYPYQFIYSEMADVLSVADLAIARSGAGTICECAALKIPLVLIPLTGEGTRGDQVDNAKALERLGGAKVLLGGDATAEKLKAALEELLDKDKRDAMRESLTTLTKGRRPAERIVDEVLS